MAMRDDKVGGSGDVASLARTKVGRDKKKGYIYISRYMCIKSI